MCLQPISIPFIAGSAKIFPCGHCAECLRHSASELVVRAFREAQEFGKVSFVTLTYDDDKLPLQITKRTDKFIKSEIIRGSDFRHKRYITEWLAQPGKVVYNKDGKSCLRRNPVCRKDRLGNDFFVYPTVYSKEVQLWLKNARVRYERSHGYKLPTFKYLVVPEYGSVTYRPHYHILFFGLDSEQISEMTSIWKYGNVDVKNISGHGKDISSVARYVTKYATKGSLDCPYIVPSEPSFETIFDLNSLPALCRKPRRFASIGFGIGNEEEFENMKNYYLCKDVFGEYSIDNLTNFTSDQLTTLVDAVIERKTYNINGFHYPLPRYLKQKIYYIKEKVKSDYDWKKDDYLFETKVRASKLQNLVAQTVVKHLVRDLNDKQEGLRRYSQVTGKSIRKVLAAHEVALQCQAEAALQKLHNELTRSIF